MLLVQWLLLNLTCYNTHQNRKAMKGPKQFGAAPAVFISHGSPMVAVQSGPYQEALANFGHSVRPRAIVAVSAHWGSGTTVAITSSARHKTVYDFGVPATLYELTYDAPGSPELADRIASLLGKGGWKTAITEDRGLDHGSWIPLRLMYPAADIPVVALSIPLQCAPEELYRLGEALAPVRSEGVMILGSGGVVHNLRRVQFEKDCALVDPWAAEFDAWFRDAVQRKDLRDLFDFATKAPHANLAVPTFEHFAPVFVILGAASNGGDASTIYEGFEHGTVSMRSFCIA